MNKSLKKILKEICAREVGKKSLYWIQALIGSCIPISESKNSIYSKDDCFLGIIHASLTNGSAESSTMLISPDTILRKTKFSMHGLKIIKENMLYGIIHTAKKHGMFMRPIDVAIDAFDDPYYGDRNDVHVVGTKRKAGTNYAHSFLCIDSLVNGERFNLGFAQKTIQTKDQNLIEQLLKDALETVDIRIALLDKEFYDVKIVKMLYHYNLKFIIPATNTAVVERLKHEYRNQLPCVVNHTMTSATGEQVKVKLALVKRNNEIYGFVTNLDWCAEDVAEHYRNRWGIETNNRMRNKFMAMTTSRSNELRFLYYLLAVMLHNIWVFLNFIASKLVYGSYQIIMIPVYKMKRFVLRILYAW